MIRHRASEGGCVDAVLAFGGGDGVLMVDDIGQRRGWIEAVMALLTWGVIILECRVHVLARAIRKYESI